VTPIYLLPSRNAGFFSAKIFILRNWIKETGNVKIIFILFDERVNFFILSRIQYQFPDLTYIIKLI